jgi:methionyl-tRNA formyltransferase
MTRYAVSILCTDPRHPVNAWLVRWIAAVADRADVRLCRDRGEVGSGDFLFLVSCQQMVGDDIRLCFRHTLVLHASDLPAGRGMSPHVWAVVSGAGELVLTLLDARDSVDSGNIWQQRRIPLEGGELFDEINAKLFDAEIELMSWAIDHCDRSRPRPQSGEPTFCRRRTPEDSRIDPQRSIAEQFDLLRVADPQRYPAFFEYRGRNYKILIERMEPQR